MTDAVRLSPGDRAPAFTLRDDAGKTVRLSDFKGQKVIVYFYPAAMTPGCTTQACDFTAAMTDFTTAGYTVLGISPDSPDKLARFRAEGGLNFTLLSDPSKATMEKYGAYGEKQLYGKTVVGVIRSTFVIDEKGRIEQAQYNVKAKGHVAKLARELDIT
ncbi:MAG TPA: thioredoxin-dependent thiol peroxidase [Actinomycetes bacterium]|nr:thioredoxin-dependent thiol peroxidase [Actinomycetes bacterium]